MNPFRLKIVAPDKVFFDGDTEQIIVRTTEGNVGILANHAKYVANLPSGALKIKDKDNKFRIAAISTGILNVADNQVTILANAIEWQDEIDVSRAKLAEDSARKKLNSQQSKKEFDMASAELKRALNRISIANK